MEATIKMRYLTILLILSSCAVRKNKPAEDFCCQNICHEMSDGIRIADSMDRFLFVIVYNEKDSSIYNNSIPEVLNYSVRKDKNYLKVLNNNYVVVKLYQEQLNSFVTTLDDYEHVDDYLKTVQENESNSYVFISWFEVLSVYNPTLLEDKANITDLILVKMGP
jgi:hypothetical protein